VVTVPERRAAVHELQERFAFSERHACELVGCARSTQRYSTRRPEPLQLCERLGTLARERPRFGYRRLKILLEREGFHVNHKRVYRLYTLAGLKLRGKRSKRRCGERRGPSSAPLAINDRWSMDFVSDRLADGRAFRAFAVVDDFGKRCTAIEVDTSLPGERVIRALERAIEMYGKPRRLVMDNGPEFTCRAFLAWVLRRGIEPCWIDPGKPIQNAYAESFNSRFRDECLNQHVFMDLRDARALIEEWRADYNAIRPHTSLGGLAPDDFSSLRSSGVPADRSELMGQLPEEAQKPEARRLS
jgi:putative transposase